jgi:hypothetical protein
MHNTYICTYMSIHYTLTHSHIHIYMHVHMHNTYKCIHKYTLHIIYIYIYIYICICMYTFIMHTYVQTNNHVSTLGRTLDGLTSVSKGCTRLCALDICGLKQVSFSRHAMCACIRTGQRLSSTLPHFEGMIFMFLPAP